MKARIEAIECYLPERVVTNEDLARENPTWNMAGIETKSGVIRRHVAEPDETALDLARRACERLFDKQPSTKAEVDGVIFCTQSPDFVMPGNSHLMHRELELRDEVLAFDFNLACSGFVYGLALAGSLIESGLARKILLITADTYSKYIHPRDRACRVLFGDAAAVTLLSASDGRQGFLGFALGTHGKGYDKFFIPAGGLKQPRSPQTCIETTDRNGNVRTPENIHMDGLAVWSFINSAVPRQIRSVAATAGMALSDIDQFIFHQASKMTLDSLVRVLEIDESRVFTNYRDIGNTVSASIPIALKEAIEQGRVKPGGRVLMSGFGVGLSYATTIMEYGD